jgi:hypothetical protein
MGTPARLSRFSRIGFLLAAMSTSTLYCQNQTPANVPALVRNDVFSLSYVDLGHAVELTMQIGKDRSPMLRIDVDQNFTIDAGVDTYYGTNGNSACNGFLIEELKSRPCGSFNSNATLSITEGRAPDQQQFRWVIPKSELGSRSTGAAFDVKVWDAASHQMLVFGSFSQPYRLTYVSSRQ